MVIISAWWAAKSKRPEPSVAFCDFDSEDETHAKEIREQIHAWIHGWTDMADPMSIPHWIVELRRKERIFVSVECSSKRGAKRIALSGGGWIRSFSVLSTKFHSAEKTPEPYLMNSNSKW